MEAPTISSILKRIEQEVDYLKNPYLTELNTEAFTQDDFLETQIQSFFTITFYAQSLTVLAAHIPDRIASSIIIEKVYEELGEGTIEDFHENKMGALLSRFSTENERTVQVWPETTGYNLALFGACHSSWSFAIGAVSMIMHMNSKIFHEIEQGVAKHKWIAEADLSYFRQREEEDRTHAQSFFEIIESSWESHHEELTRGLEFGAYLHNRFYLDLYENRKRR